MKINNLILGILNHTNKTRDCTTQSLSNTEFEELRCQCKFKKNSAKFINLSVILISTTKMSTKIKKNVKLKTHFKEANL